MVRHPLDYPAQFPAFRLRGTDPAVWVAAQVSPTLPAVRPSDWKEPGTWYMQDIDGTYRKEPTTRALALLYPGVWGYGDLPWIPGRSEEQRARAVFTAYYDSYTGRLFMFGASTGPLASEMICMLWEEVFLSRVRYVMHREPLYGPHNEDYKKSPERMKSIPLPQLPAYWTQQTENLGCIIARLGCPRMFLTLTLDVALLQPWIDQLAPVGFGALPGTTPLLTETYFN
jgi:hypothetical protein